MPKRSNIRTLLVVAGLTLVMFFAVTTTFLALKPQAQIDPDRAHGLPFAVPFTDSALITGSGMITGNFSVVSQTFSVGPGPQNTINMYAFRVLMVCDSNAGLFGEYCDQPALTNGIFTRIIDDSGVIGAVNPLQAIKNNRDWLRLCNVDIKDEPGNAKQTISVLCKFGESDNVRLQLNGAKGEKLQFLFLDDFSGLSFHGITALGDVE